MSGTPTLTMMRRMLADRFRIAARIAWSFGALLACIAVLALRPVLADDADATTVAFAAMAILIGTALGWSLHRTIAREISEITSVARRMAAGDLTEPFQSRAHGELGESQRALRQMSDNVFGVIARVRAGTSSIASTSAHMNTDNTALAARTQAQASALEETASAMEQLTATVRQNADNARHANSMMTSASASAAKGVQGIAEVAQAMAGIKERSGLIADITSVIDGIAFQTNILALNAAVEAARAGADGRGFAVVAGEVRALAQRAADAAQQIRVLLTGSAEQVHAGSQLVGEAGIAMDEIRANVESVAGVMREIAAAAAEQSAGLEEINRAVMQIDGMTQQNAALVEMVTRTATGLQEEAEQLTDAAAAFRLGAREFGSADEAVALVHAGVEFARSHGRDAFVAEVNRLGRGRFIDRDLYLSAYAMDGSVAAHGANRRFWNVDWTDFKDAAGRRFVAETVALAATSGKGWIDYQWVHPVSKQTLVKTAYFEKCADLVIACGVYGQQASLASPTPGGRRGPA